MLHNYTVKSEYFIENLCIKLAERFKNIMIEFILLNIQTRVCTFAT